MGVKKGREHIEVVAGLDPVTHGGARDATIISCIALMRDPLGTNLSKYDLFSPEAILRSVNSMVAGQDLRAAWQFFKGAIQSESGPEMKLFFSADAKIVVLNSRSARGRRLCRWPVGEPG